MTPDYEPRAIHDIGSERDAFGLPTHWKKVQKELERLFPGRHILVWGCSAPDGAAPPSGYHTIDIRVMRKLSESDAGFDELRKRVERVLDDTELALTQPGTGAPYLKTVDSVDAEPIWGPIGGNPQAVVGWRLVAFLAPTLVKAEDIELLNERIRSERTRLGNPP